MNNLKGGKAAYQMNIIETIGYEGPNISLAITSLALLDQKKYLVSFVLFYFVEYYLNGALKRIIKQPRPEGFLGMNDTGVYDTATEKYGMPSGHSSAVWYSTVFLWLVKKSPNLLILELAICFNTMYQRWSFKKHSIEQLAVGMLLGGSVAWIAVFVTKKALK